VQSEGFVPPATAAAHEGRRLVLLAEDDADFRHLVASVLAADGYEVVEAVDGLDLLAHVERELGARGERADAFLIVADVCMPGLTGLDVLAILRCANWTTPVILITGFGDEATRAEGRELGASAVLDKPFALDDFRATVAGTLPPR
jgi:DNA-binding response OmpR family regulator